MRGAFPQFWCVRAPQPRVWDDGREESWKRARKRTGARSGVPPAPGLLVGSTRERCPSRARLEHTERKKRQLANPGTAN